MFITAFKRTRHPPLSWARSVQSLPPPQTTSWRSILNIILPSTSRSSQVFCFPPVSPPKTPYTPLLFPYTCYMPHPSHSRFYHPNNIWWGVQIMKLLIVYFSPFPVTSSILGPDILLNTLFSDTFSLRSSVNVSDQVSHPYKTSITFKLEVCHPRCVFENWKGYVVKHNYVN